MKWLAVAVLAAAPLCAGTAVDEAAKRFDAAAAKVPGALGAAFRAWGCGALKKAGCEVPAPGAIDRAGRRPSAEAQAITARLRTIRGLPTDADRARVVAEIAGEIRALPSGAEKLSLARGLCGLVTEGDLGKNALTAAAQALADGIKGSTADAGVYVELASLVVYEQVVTPLEDPALDAAAALLHLREAMHQEAGFTLNSLDGKTYSLEGLRGKVVLLNFWATWCPPCRKEMPDLEKLYGEFGAKGFVVLAVSDEKREVVEKFWATRGTRFQCCWTRGGRCR
jgi:thiol-disulfide isomerase/thioredoxin